MTARPLRPLAAAVLLGLVSLGVIPGLLRVRIDNSPERFFARDEKSVVLQEDLRRLFGGERRVLLALKSSDLWTAGGLDAIAKVEQAAMGSAAVVRTTGLWSRHRWLEPEWPPRDVGAFVSRARQDRLARAAGLIGDSSTIVAVAVDLEESSGPDEVAELESTVRAAAPVGLDVELIGLPVVERTMDRGIRKLLQVNFPALLIVSALLLWIGFRSWTEAALALLFVMVVELTTLGVLGAFGATLDMVSSVLFPLLFVISLATVVHMQAAFRRELEAGLEAVVACREAVRRKRLPVIWTTLTTMVAFASFATSSLPPLRSLGLWLAGGLMFLIVGAFGIYPALMRTTGGVDGDRRSLERDLRRCSGRLAFWVEEMSGRVLVVFGGLALIAGIGFTKLRVEGSLISYLSPEDPGRRTATLLQDEGIGAGAAELVIKLPPETTAEMRFRNPEALERLGSLSSSLRNLEGVLGAVGAGDLYATAVDDVVLSGEPSAGVRWLVLGLMQADPGVAARLATLLADEDRAARITLLLPLEGPRELDPVLEAAQEMAERAFPAGTVSVAGELPLVLASQRRLLTTLATSFAMTIGVITLVIATIARSFPAFLLYLLPNLWAVLAVIGTMGWLGIPLDSTTVMIAAVALGLAVDDTLHTMAEAGTDLSRVDARRLAEVLERVVPAHLLTSLVLAAGFSVVACADFLPIARFGALAALGVAAALAGDLLLLPALLARRAGYSGPSSRTMIGMREGSRAGR